MNEATGGAETGSSGISPLPITWAVAVAVVEPLTLPRAELTHIAKVLSAQYHVARRRGGSDCEGGGEIGGP